MGKGKKDKVQRLLYTAYAITRQGKAVDEAEEDLIEAKQDMQDADTALEEAQGALYEASTRVLACERYLQKQRAAYTLMTQEK